MKLTCLLAKTFHHQCSLFSMYNSLKWAILGSSTLALANYKSGAIQAHCNGAKLEDMYQYWGSIFCEDIREDRPKIATFLFPRPIRRSFLLKFRYKTDTSVHGLIK